MGKKIVTCRLFSSIGGKELLLYLITFSSSLNINGIYKNLHKKIINAVKKLNSSPRACHSCRIVNNFQI